MTSSEWAAWVQAVGSVLAIGVAVYVPNAIQRRQERGKETADLLIARDRALSLIYPLKQWIQRTASWSDALATKEVRNDLMVVGWVATRFDSLELPDAIKDLKGNLHELGKAAKPVQNLVYWQGVAAADRNAMNSLARGDFVEEKEARLLRQQHATTLRNLFAAMSASYDAVSDLLAQK